MTDFLTRVAQRSLGVAAVVQPVMGSRYAPTPNLSLPPIIPPEDRTLENPAEQAPDLENLPGDVSSSSTAGQVMQPVPSVKPVRTPDAPFEASASPAQTYLGNQSLSESEPDALALPAENIQARARPSEEALEQSLTLIIGEPSTTARELQQPAAQINDVRPTADHSSRVNNSGAIIPREDVDSFDPFQREETESEPVLSLPRPELRIDTKPASHHGRELVDSPSIETQEEESFEANDSGPGTFERQRGAPLTAPLSSEAIDAESTEEILAQDGRSERHISPSTGDHTLFNQSIVRDVNQPLLSSKDLDDWHASPEKIIRVTIGRIEVRAVAPPSQPVESPAPPAPKLSLDEFLRQHNGRRQ